MSKLIVEVCKIEEIKNHSNADKLDIVKIKGWQCIVGRNQYKIGDFVVYCPPDSVIPNTLVEKYKLEFLKKNGKVGSIKLRGELSQGLILNPPDDIIIYEGLNVAEIMGITKYEPPEPEYSIKNTGIVSKRQSNPLFDKYTDIENINNFNSILEEGEEVVITEKIHGCNARFGRLKRPTNNILDWIKNLIFGQYEFIYGSRTVQKKWTNIHKGYYKEDVWGKIARKFEFDKIIPKDYIIYGEIYGDKIQDLTYGLKEEEIAFRAFDVKYKGKYLNYEQFKEFCSSFSIPIVPELFRGLYQSKLEDKFKVGNSIIDSNQIREGCVVKPATERENHLLGRVILKSINPDYLTRKNGTESH